MTGHPFGTDNELEMADPRLCLTEELWHKFIVVNVGHKSALYVGFMHLNSFQATLLPTSTGLH